MIEQGDRAWLSIMDENAAETDMDVKKQIKSILNQAEVYRSQGLLREARDKYVRAGKMIQKHAGLIRNHKSLLVSLNKKISAVKIDLQKMEDAPATKEMPEAVQQIIKEHFAFTENEETRELAEALALVRFGQYTRALEDLKGLLKNEQVRTEAAKNLIRCQLTLGAVDEAVQQYQGWMKSEIFTTEEARSLRIFFQNMLDKKDSEIILPEVGAETEAEDAPLEMAHASAEAVQPEDLLDISSVGIPTSEGAAAGRTRECDVCFQSGNILNLLLSDREKDVLDILEPNSELEPVEFFSPIAMFEGKAKVLSRKKLETGPKKGDFSIDIQIVGLF